VVWFYILSQRTYCIFYKNV